MKNLKLLIPMIVLLLTTVSFVALSQTTDTGTEEAKVSIWQWLTGGGSIGALGYLFKKLKDLSGLAKEIMDVPIAIVKGMSAISAETQEANVRITMIIETIQNYANKPNLKVKDLAEDLKDQIEKAKADLIDIPKTIKAAGEDIAKEVNDIIKRKK